MSTPVLKSCCRTVRYHLGTVMFGGFIIAVVQFVRAALAYVEENTKTWQEKNKVRFFKIQKKKKKEKKKMQNQLTFFPLYFFFFIFLILSTAVKMCIQINWMYIVLF